MAWLETCTDANKRRVSDVTRPQNVFVNGSDSFAGWTRTVTVSAYEFFGITRAAAEAQQAVELAAEPKATATIEPREAGENVLRIGFETTSAWEEIPLDE